MRKKKLTKIKRKRNNFLDLVPLLLIQIVWGSYFVIAKDLQKEINVYFLHSLRFSILALCLLPFVVRHNHKARFVLSGIFAGILLAANNYLLNIGLNLGSAANAAFLLGTGVVFTPLVETIFFKNKINKVRIIAVGIALGGVWVLTGGVTGFDLGDFVLTVSTFFGALHIVTVDKSLDKKSHFISFVFWQILVCAIVGHFMNINYGSFDLPELNLANIGAFSYLTFISMGLGMIVLMWTQGRVNDVIISIVFLLQTLTGGIFAWTFGHEPLLFSHIIGGGLIMISMLLSVISDKDSNLKSLD